MVVLTVVATVSMVAMPTLLTYWDSWVLQSAAREVASVINLARQLAIASRATVCVDLTAATLRFRLGGCGGTLWTGPVTDAIGAIRISDPMTVDVSANGRPVFTALGAASPGATYTLRHTRSHASRTVIVAGSGRISVE